MSIFSTSPALARALDERRFSQATPVQEAVLQPEMAGRDLLVSSQTGSGKTVAYGLAMGETLLGSDERFGPAGRPLALIIAPTRELALQVQRELAWLYAQTGARILSCVGGMDPRREAMALSEGGHIVVGTPGRLRDHIERGRLDLSALRVVVLDEADEMLDLGFSEDLAFISQAAPKERRSLLFSATFPKAILALAAAYQHDAVRIEVAGGARGHADIAYQAVRVYPKEAELAVVNLLRFHEAPCALVFCNTRSAVNHLQAVLLERGFAVVALSGELSQHERNGALQALRDGRARVCVATDVAARGIDLPGLTLVIHAELPHDAEVMQHRSGRTGRAGRKGISALLVPVSRRRKAEMLIAQAGVTVEWMGAPGAEAIHALDETRLLADPLLQGEPAPEEEGMIAALMQGRSSRDIAAALVRVYRARLPAAEEVGDPGFSVGGPARAERSRESYATRDREGPRERVPARAPGAPRGETVWFRLDIGRKQGADPRQLLPMICRRGQITRDQVGAIRIFERETKIEIDAEAAERFAELVRKPDRDSIAITPAAEAGEPHVREPRKASFRKPDTRGFEPHPPARGGEAPAGERPRRPSRWEERQQGSGGPGERGPARPAAKSWKGGANEGERPAKRSFSPKSGPRGGAPGGGFAKKKKPR